jgi:hypothetical protein
MTEECVTPLRRRVIEDMSEKLVSGGPDPGNPNSTLIY